MPAADFPHLVKHMTLAIYKRDYLHGSKERKFAAALEIALSRLVEWKYLTPKSHHDAPKGIHMTPKGVKREILHRMESPGKSLKFDKLYGLIESGMEVPDVQGTTDKKTEQKAAVAKAVFSGPPVDVKVKTMKRRGRVRKTRSAHVRRAKRR